MLGDLQPILNLSVTELERLMERHDISVLPDKEELWEVPEPVRPKPLRKWQTRVHFNDAINCTVHY